MLDRHTELVHFGFRDYDPIAGRFTTPDPAKDARGDGDLFDYCVDNPVGRRDPTGLLAPLPLAALGGMGSLGIAGLGTYGSASLVDWINKRQTGESSTAAVDAVNRVAPMVAGTVLGSHAASGAAGMAPSVVGSGLNVLTPAAVELGKYPAVINAIPDAISGFIVPGPPPPSLAGNVAGLASNTASELGIWDWIKNLFD